MQRWLGKREAASGACTSVLHCASELCHTHHPSAPRDRIRPPATSHLLALDTGPLNSKAWQNRDVCCAHTNRDGRATRWSAGPWQWLEAAGNLFFVLWSRAQLSAVSRLSEVHSEQLTRTGCDGSESNFRLSCPQGFLSDCRTSDPASQSKAEFALHPLEPSPHSSCVFLPTHLQPLQMASQGCHFP